MLLFIAACSKEDPAPVNTADPDIVQKQVTDDLADQDNLKGFTEALASRHSTQYGFACQILYN